MHIKKINFKVIFVVCAKIKTNININQWEHVIINFRKIQLNCILCTCNFILFYFYFLMAKITILKYFKGSELLPLKYD